MAKILSGITLILLLTLLAGCAELSPLEGFRKTTLDDMYPILTEKQYSELRTIHSEESINEFVEQFWKDADPTPRTSYNELREEYNRRLEYANKHFPDRKGWGRSDMKRIYLRYGPPSYIDRDHYTDEQLGPFQKIKAREIWIYMTPEEGNIFPSLGDKTYLGQRKFIFADLVGSGVYKIIYSSEDGGDIDTRMYDWK